MPQNRSQNVKKLSSYDSKKKKRSVKMSPTIDSKLYIHYLSKLEIEAKIILVIITGNTLINYKI